MRRSHRASLCRQAAGRTAGSRRGIARLYRVIGLNVVWVASRWGACRSVLAAGNMLVVACPSASIAARIRTCHRASRGLTRFKGKRWIRTLPRPACLCCGAPTSSPGRGQRRLPEREPRHPVIRLSGSRGVWASRWARAKPASPLGSCYGFQDIDKQVGETAKHRVLNIHAGVAKAFRSVQRASHTHRRTSCVRERSDVQRWCFSQARP